MQFFVFDKNKKDNRLFCKGNDKREVDIFRNKQIKFWILKISLTSFFLSLFLSLFSEIFFNSKNVFVSCVFLGCFMLLNIISDMVGLAIASCQIDKLKKVKNNNKIYETSLMLIKNSDKVSSVLCDVIGDLCGILCGVCGSILAIILSQKLACNIVFMGAFVSSIIVGVTVLFKAILKNYAIKHSTNIVLKSARLVLRIKSIFRRKNNYK